MGRLLTSPHSSISMRYTTSGIGGLLRVGTALAPILYPRSPPYCPQLAKTRVIQIFGKQISIGIVDWYAISTSGAREIGLARDY